MSTRSRAPATRACLPTGGSSPTSSRTIDREESAYRSAIWVVPVDGSDEPRQFTSGERRDASPRWSPDGRPLAFASNRDGEDEAKAKAQLYVMPADGGEPRKLTDGDESVEAIAWSPDSTRIAFARRVRDAAYEEEDDRKRAPRRFTRVFYKLDSVGWIGDRRKHLFVVGADGPGDDSRAAAHRRRLRERQPGVVARRQADRVRLVRGDRWDVEFIGRLYELEVDASGRRAAAPDGGRRAGIAAVLLSRRLASPTTARPRTARIRTTARSRSSERTAASRASSPPRSTGTASRTPPCASRSGTTDRIVFAVEDGGNVHLYAVAPDGSAEPELLAGGERTIGLYDAVDGDSSTPRARTRVRTSSSATTTAAHARRRRVHGRHRARRAGALHRDLEGRHRGRRVARPPRRLRGGQELPDAAHHPRRPVLAVRHRLLRRGAGLLRRRLRGALLEPARRLGLLGGVGTRDPRADRRRRQRLGRRRLRGSDGRRRHGAREVRRSSTPTGSA